MLKTQAELDSQEANRATIARGLLIAQTKRELLARLEKYHVGCCVEGQFLASKDTETLDGVYFIIPKADYLELFKEVSGAI